MTKFAFNADKRLIFNFLSWFNLDIENEENLTVKKIANLENSSEFSTQRADDLQNYEI